MAKFKAGDRVRVSKNCDANVKHLIGNEYTIKGINYSGSYELVGSRFPGWHEYELELIKDTSMSTKYYRNLKPNFLWEEGAILSNESEGDGYKAINDLWDKTDAQADEYISAGIIEHEDNKELFERVYPIGDLKKMLFGNKAAARAAISEGAYKAKKK